MEAIIKKHELLRSEWDYSIVVLYNGNTFNFFVRAVVSKDGDTFIQSLNYLHEMTDYKPTNSERKLLKQEVKNFILNI